MIQHIVLFRFRPDVTASIREAARNAFKEGIESLPVVIPQIRKIFVGFNTNPAETWDICLTSTFDTMEDVQTYSAHPAHKAIGRELMQHIAERACTDFEE